MSDVAKEYLAPDPGEEKRKAFTLSPAPEDFTQAILQSRRDVVTDPDLSPGAKLLFVYLLDLSLLWSVSRWRGVVTISFSKLSTHLHKSKSTLERWEKELVERRCVWVTKQYMPNCKPMNVYHISALDKPEQPAQLPSKDGLWGNRVQGDWGAKRVSGAANFAAAGAPKGQYPPAGLVVSGAESPQTVDNGTAKGQKQVLPVPLVGIAKGQIRDCQGSEMTPGNTHQRDGQGSEMTPGNTHQRDGQGSEMTPIGEPQSRENEQGKEQRGREAPPEASREDGKAVRLSGAEIILREKELKRIEAKIEALRGQKPWSEAEKAQVRTLKERKAEVLKLLGMIV